MIPLRPHKPPSAYELKAREQSRIATARARQAKVDATPIGQQRIAAAAEFCARMQAERAVLDAFRKIKKDTGTLRLTIIGRLDFAEPAPGKDHSLMMDERRALGQALDWIQPTCVVTAGQTGPERLAAIWASRRGIAHEVTAPGDKPDAVAAFGEDTFTADRVARLKADGVPVYVATVASH